jgi:hypothetical protein
MEESRLPLRSARDEVIRDIEETIKRVPTPELEDCLKFLREHALPLELFLPSLRRAE